MRSRNTAKLIAPVPIVVSSSVCPSGSLRATNSAPTLPVALFALGGVIAIVAFVGLFIEAMTGPVAQNVALAGFGLSIVVVVWQSFGKPNHDRDRIFAAMFLIIGSILFWALFEQAYTSLNLFTERKQGAIFFESYNNKNSKEK